MMDSAIDRIKEQNEAGVEHFLSALRRCGRSARLKRFAQEPMGRYSPLDNQLQNFPAQEGDICYFASYDLGPRTYLSADRSTRRVSLVHHQQSLQYFDDCLWRIVPALQYDAADEEHCKASNEALLRNLLEEGGDQLLYGNVIQLQHVSTGLFLTMVDEPTLGRDNVLKLTSGAPDSYVTIQPRFKAKMEGGLVIFTEQVLLKCGEDGYVSGSVAEMALGVFNFPSNQGLYDDDHDSDSDSDSDTEIDHHNEHDGQQQRHPLSARSAEDERTRVPFRSLNRKLELQVHERAMCFGMYYHKRPYLFTSPATPAQQLEEDRTDGEGVSASTTAADTEVDGGLDVALLSGEAVRLYHPERGAFFGATRTEKTPVLRPIPDQDYENPENFSANDVWVVEVLNRNTSLPALNAQAVTWQDEVRLRHIVTGRYLFMRTGKSNHRRPYLRDVNTVTDYEKGGDEVARLRFRLVPAEANVGEFVDSRGALLVLENQAFGGNTNWRLVEQRHKSSGELEFSPQRAKRGPGGGAAAAGGGAASDAPLSFGIGGAGSGAGGPGGEGSALAAGGGLSGAAGEAQQGAQETEDAFRITVVDDYLVERIRTMIAYKQLADAYTWSLRKLPSQSKLLSKARKPHVDGFKRVGSLIRDAASHAEVECFKAQEAGGGGGGDDAGRRNAGGRQESTAEPVSAASSNRTRRGRNPLTRSLSAANLRVTVPEISTVLVRDMLCSAVATLESSSASLLDGDGDDPTAVAPGPSSGADPGTGNADEQELSWQVRLDNTLRPAKARSEAINQQVATETGFLHALLMVADTPLKSGIDLGFHRFEAVESQGAASLESLVREALQLRSNAPEATTIAASLTRELAKRSQRQATDETLARRSAIWLLTRLAQRLDVSRHRISRRVMRRYVRNRLPIQYRERAKDLASLIMKQDSKQEAAQRTEEKWQEAPLWVLQCLVFRTIQQIIYDNRDIEFHFAEQPGYIELLLQQAPYPVGAAVCFSQLISNNRLLIEKYVTLSVIDTFVGFIRKYGPSARFLEFFVAISSCQGEQVLALQERTMHRISLREFFSSVIIRTSDRSAATVASISAGRGAPARSPSLDPQSMELDGSFEAPPAIPQQPNQPLAQQLMTPQAPGAATSGLGPDDVCTLLPDGTIQPMGHGIYLGALFRNTDLEGTGEGFRRLLESDTANERGSFTTNEHVIWRSTGGLQHLLEKKGTLRPRHRVRHPHSGVESAQYLFDARIMPANSKHGQSDRFCEFTFPRVCISWHGSPKWKREPSGGSDNTPEARTRAQWLFLDAATTLQNPDDCMRIGRYYEKLLDCMSEMCLGRSYNCMKILQDEFPLKRVVSGIADETLPFQIRASFTNLLHRLWIDRAPHEPNCGRSSIPELVWIRTSADSRENDDNDAEDAWQDGASTGTDVLPCFRNIFKHVADCDVEIDEQLLPTDLRECNDSNRFFFLQEFISDHLDIVGASQDATACERNIFTIQLLAILEKLISFGMYAAPAEITDVWVPLMSCLAQNVSGLDVPGGAPHSIWAAVQDGKLQTDNDSDDMRVYLLCKTRMVQAISRMLNLRANYLCATTLSMLRRVEDEDTVSEDSSASELTEESLATLLRGDLLQFEAVDQDSNDGADNDETPSTTAGLWKSFRSAISGHLSGAESESASAAAEEALPCNLTWSDKCFLELMLHEDDDLFAEAFSLMRNRYRQVETVTITLHEAVELPSDIVSAPFYRFSVLDDCVSVLRALSDASEVWAASNCFSPQSPELFSVVYGLLNMIMAFLNSEEQIASRRASKHYGTQATNIWRLSKMWRKGAALNDMTLIQDQDPSGAAHLRQTGNGLQAVATAWQYGQRLSNEFATQAAMAREQSHTESVAGGGQSVDHNSSFDDNDDGGFKGAISFGNTERQQRLLYLLALPKILIGIIDMDTSLGDQTIQVRMNAYADDLPAAGVQLRTGNDNFFAQLRVMRELIPSLADVWDLAYKARRNKSVGLKEVSVSNVHRDSSMSATEHIGGDASNSPVPGNTPPPASEGADSSHHGTDGIDQQTQPPQQQQQQPEREMSTLVTFVCQHLPGSHIMCGLINGARIGALTLPSNPHTSWRPQISASSGGYDDFSSISAARQLEESGGDESLYDIRELMCRSTRLLYHTIKDNSWVKQKLLYHFPSLLDKVLEFKSEPGPRRELLTLLQELVYPHIPEGSWTLDPTTEEALRQLYSRCTPQDKDGVLRLYLSLVAPGAPHLQSLVLDVLLESGSHSLTDVYLSYDVLQGGEPAESQNRRRLSALQHALHEHDHQLVTIRMPGCADRHGTFLGLVPLGKDIYLEQYKENEFYTVPKAVLQHMPVVQIGVVVLCREKFNTIQPYRTVVPLPHICLPSEDDMLGANGATMPTIAREGGHGGAHSEHGPGGDEMSGMDEAHEKRNGTTDHLPEGSTPSTSLPDRMQSKLESAGQAFSRRRLLPPIIDERITDEGEPETKEEEEQEEDDEKEEKTQPAPCSLGSEVAGVSPASGGAIAPTAVESALGGSSSTLAQPQKAAQPSASTAKTTDSRDGTWAHYWTDIKDGYMNETVWSQMWSALSRQASRMGISANDLRSLEVCEQCLHGLVHSHELLVNLLIQAATANHNCSLKLQRHLSWNTLLTLVHSNDTAPNTKTTLLRLFSCVFVEPTTTDARVATSQQAWDIFERLLAVHAHKAIGWRWLERQTIASAAQSNSTHRNGPRTGVARHDVTASARFSVIQKRQTRTFIDTLLNTVSGFVVEFGNNVIAAGVTSAMANTARDMLRAARRSVQLGIAESVSLRLAPEAMSMLVLISNRGGVNPSGATGAASGPLGVGGGGGLDSRRSLMVSQPRDTAAITGVPGVDGTTPRENADGQPFSFSPQHLVSRHSFVAHETEALQYRLKRSGVWQTLQRMAARERKDMVENILRSFGMHLYTERLFDNYADALEAQDSGMMESLMSTVVGAGGLASTEMRREEARQRELDNEARFMIWARRLRRYAQRNFRHRAESVASVLSLLGEILCYMRFRVELAADYIVEHDEDVTDDVDLEVVESEFLDYQLHVARTAHQHMQQVFTNAGFMGLLYEVVGSTDQTTQDENILYSAALVLGTEILSGGFVPAQESLFQHVAAADADGRFFRDLQMRMRTAKERMLQGLFDGMMRVRVVTRNFETEERLQISLVFRFLAQCCEGHNLSMQQMLQDQRTCGIRKSVDLLQEACSFGMEVLGLVSSDMSSELRVAVHQATDDNEHANDTGSERSDAGSGTSSSAGGALLETSSTIVTGALQSCFLFINEAIQGPCLMNQDVVAKSSIGASIRSLIKTVIHVRVDNWMRQQIARHPDLAKSGGWQQHQLFILLGHDIGLLELCRTTVSTLRSGLEGRAGTEIREILRRELSMSSLQQFLEIAESLNKLLRRVVVTSMDNDANGGVLAFVVRSLFRCAGASSTNRPRGGAGPGRGDPDDSSTNRTAAGSEAAAAGPHSPRTPASPGNHGASPSSVNRKSSRKVANADDLTTGGASTGGDLQPQDTEQAAMAQLEESNQEAVEGALEYMLQVEVDEAQIKHSMKSFEAELAILFNLLFPDEETIDKTSGEELVSVEVFFKGHTETVYFIPPEKCASLRIITMRKFEDEVEISNRDTRLNEFMSAVPGMLDEMEVLSSVIQTPALGFLNRHFFATRSALYGLVVLLCFNVLLNGDRPGTFLDAQTRYGALIMFVLITIILFGYGMLLLYALSVSVPLVSKRLRRQAMEIEKAMPPANKRIDGLEAFDIILTVFTLGIFPLVKGLIVGIPRRLLRLLCLPTDARIAAAEDDGAGGANESAGVGEEVSGAVEMISTSEVATTTTTQPRPLPPGQKPFQVSSGTGGSTLDERGRPITSPRAAQELRAELFRRSSSHVASPQTRSIMMQSLGQSFSHAPRAVLARGMSKKTPQFSMASTDSRDEEDYMGPPYRRTLGGSGASDGAAGVWGSIADADADSDSDMSEDGYQFAHEGDEQDGVDNMAEHPVIGDSIEDMVMYALEEFEQRWHDLRIIVAPFQNMIIALAFFILVCVIHASRFPGLFRVYAGLCFVTFVLWFFSCTRKFLDENRYLYIPYSRRMQAVAVMHDNDQSNDDLSFDARSTIASYFAATYDAVTFEENVWLIVLCGLALLGYYRVWVLPFMLLDLITISADVKNILYSVTTPGRSLILLLCLYLFVIAIFASVGTASYEDSTWVECEEEDCPDDVDEETTKSLLQTFLLFINAGDAIGDFMAPVLYKDGGTFGYTMLFQQAHFLLVGVLLFDMVTGIIVDTFGSLREDLNNRRDLQENENFVSGLSRSKFDEAGLDFDELQANRQNLWKYLHFVAYLRDKDPAELTGTESHVVALLDAGDHSWLPRQTCVWMEDAARRATEQGDESVKLLHSTIHCRLAAGDDNLRAVHMNLSRKLADIAQQLEALRPAKPEE